MEVYYNRLFISKSDDLIFLINLIFKNDNNNNSDTHSKFYQMNMLIDKIKQFADFKYSSSKDIDNFSFIYEDELEKVFDLHTVSEFVKFNCKNNLISHIKNLCVHYL